jgi:Acetamidase/Formamidase family
MDEVRAGARGWTWAGGWWSVLGERLRLPDLDGHLLEWELDDAAGVARDGKGREVELRPFLGILGMPPGEPGKHSTMPPRTTGGNIDCKELVVGSTLLLPIAVEGALFSAGDGHAAQGDGEVGQMAIECPLERVQLTLSVREDLTLVTPCALTPTAWIAFGFDEDLDEAVVQALNGMLDLMDRELGSSARRRWHSPASSSISGSPRSSTAFEAPTGALDSRRCFLLTPEEQPLPTMTREQAAFHLGFFVDHAIGGFYGRAPQTRRPTALVSSRR